MKVGLIYNATVQNKFHLGRGIEKLWYDSMIIKYDSMIMERISVDVKKFAGIWMVIRIYSIAHMGKGRALGKYDRIDCPKIQSQI